MDAKQITDACERLRAAWEELSNAGCYCLQDEYGKPSLMMRPKNLHETFPAEVKAVEATQWPGPGGWPLQRIIEVGGCTVCALYSHEEVARFEEAS